MQRTKEGGCDPSLTGNTSNGAGTTTDQSDTGSHYKYDVTPGYKVEMDAQEHTASVNSAIDRNKTVNCLRDICGAKLKDDDILVSLTDSEWKVDQTAEKLLNLNLAAQQETQISTVCTSDSNGQQKSLKLNLATAKLPPQSGDPVVLPLLSPKTPHVVASFLNYGESATPETVQPAMDALDRFGETTSGLVYLDPSGESFPHSPGSLMEPGTPHGVGLTPVAGGPTAGSLFVLTQQSSDGPGLSTIIEHQRTESLSPSSQGEVNSVQYNSGPSLIQEQAVSPSAMSAAFPQRVMSLTVPPADSNSTSQNKSQVHVPQKPRGSRKKTLSLNPEEREALENLIEDVIMGGVASDESSNSSDSDDDGQLQDGSGAAGGNKEGVLNKEGLPKIYPAQLKVAVKHMRNLPPRFMRRLENAQKKIDAAERIEAERAREEQARLELEAREKEQERLKSREDQKREKKKKIRNLLDDLDQYTDEQSVSQNKDTEQGINESNEKREAQNKVITEQTKEVEDFMESSQPVHVGLSKGQNSQAVLSHQEHAQKHLPCQNSSMSGIIPTGKVMNCEDLERELLNRVDYGVPTSMPVFCNNQQANLGAAGSAMPMNILAYNFASGQNSADMVDRRTFLSADAPEFVPLNLLSYGPQLNAQNFQSAAMHVQAPNLQMQSSGSTIQCQNPHVLLSNSNQHDSKFRPLPKSSSPACIEMLQSNSSSQYSQSPVGRMSPQVVNAHTSRSSPQLVPASAADGTVPPPPPTSQSVGKLPTFLVPKVPTTIPMHQPSAPPAPVPQHQGIAGVIPINPYQIPYNYATAAFPPQQGFTYQPFFPPASYMPWNEGGSDKLGPGGLIGHHSLIGVPLKASPQMTRKRGTPHPGPRPGGTPVRHNVLQTNKSPASDVKVLNAESAKKLLMQLFEEGKKVLVLLRGCPGSGKSSLAKEIVFDGTILSTDDYFINSQGVYEYDKATLGEAHVWNQNRAKQALEAGTNPIIIDNTNTQSWEMKSYVSMAQKQGYHIEIIEPNTPWRQNAKELAKRNIHGVSVSSIRKMLELYEHNVTLQSIIGVQTPAEKQTPAETQQQNQSDGEQQEQKTPHKRRRKKRKRKRHRSKKDKGGNPEEAQRPVSGESSDEDDTPEKGTVRGFRLVEKRSSVTSNETTTSPRETTPELMERSDQWENAFSDIKEDSQHEQDRAKDAEELEQQQHVDNEGKCCPREGDAFVEDNIHVDVKEFKEEDDNDGVHVLDAGIKTGDYGHDVSDLAEYCRSSSSGMDHSVARSGENGAASAACDNRGRVLAGHVFNKEYNSPDGSGDLSDVGSCHSGGDSDEVENIVAAIISELLSLVDSRMSDALQSQHCAQTDPGTFANNCMNEETSDNSCTNHVNDTTLVSAETCISTNSCDQHFSNNVMTVCSNSAVMSDNTASESVIASDLLSAKTNEKLALKHKITDCLQERVLQALLEQELMIILDDTGEYLECGSHDNKTSLLPDTMSELDESGEMHPTTLDDLKKALEDINYDNPVLDFDSDIELDYEYGLEATGTSLKIQDSNTDNSKKVNNVEYSPLVMLDEKEEHNMNGNDVADQKSAEQPNSEALDFSGDNENSPLTTSDDPAKIASGCKDIKECKHDVLSEGFSQSFSEKQKIVEEQYWVTRNADTYCIPLTNSVNVYPGINSPKGDFRKDAHVDCMEDGKLLSTDLDLVKPKPKRERTIKKRAFRKSRSVDVDKTGGKHSCDEWTSSNKPDHGFQVSDDYESVDKEDIQSPHNSVAETCDDYLTSAYEICCQAQQIMKQAGSSDAVVGSASIDESSQTEPRDLVFVHRLRESDLEAVLVIDHFSIQGILETTPRDISGSNNVNTSVESHSSHSWICKVHSSSQTDDIPELMEGQQLQDKIVTLQMCFPNISKEDVEHILEQCQGDMEWASNILLDGSTESCLPEKEDKTECDNQTSNVVCDVTEHHSPKQQDHLTEKSNSAYLKRNIQDPESLVEICCKKLVSPDLYPVSNTVLRETDGIRSDHLPDVYQQNVETLDTKIHEEACASLSHSTPKTSANTDSSSTQETPVTEYDSRNRVVLKMPKEFAEQLLQLFGPVQNLPATVTLADGSMNVDLDRKTAKEIYDCWAKTLTEKSSTSSAEPDNSNDTVSNDEALARCLQEEEYRSVGSRHVQTNSLCYADGLHQTGKGKNNKRGRSPYSSPSCHSTGTASPTKNGSRTSSPTKVITLNRSDRSQSPKKSSNLTSPSRQAAVPNLREIMDEEMALEASLAEYLSCQNDVLTNKDTLSTRLNWQKLIERFPKVDEVMLYDVFQSTGYHMESTISTIERSLSLQGPPKTVMTQEVAEQMERQMFKQAVEESLKMWPDAEEIPTKEDLYQTLEDPLYSDFRAEAYEHYKQRQECLKKAAIAYRKGMLQVASYYSQQSQLHYEKLKDANHRTAEMIVNYKAEEIGKTNCLDLHGLHVDEALKTLEAVLAKRETEQREKPDKRKSHLLVVTGRGTHSRGGVARIRPAVLDFLRKHHYSFTETSPSVVKVHLKYRDAYRP